MGRFRLIVLFSLMVAVLSVPSLARNVFVAVLETVTLGTTISNAERIYLTDKLRSKAIEVLPAYNNFVIMTRDNMIAMLPPGSSLEDCADADECMVQTGRNISADYVAQARVGQFGSDLTLTVELYETASGKMLANYTSKNSSVDELLAEIEGRSAMLFGVIPGAVKSNAGFDDGRGGISNLSTGRQWSSSKVKKRLVKISTEPSGALLNVDGRPQSNCRSTPCTVELSEGNHKFTLVLDRYFDLDTVVMVNGYTDKLKAKMKPNFGKLVIDPEFPDGLGDSDGLTIYVDGEEVPWKTELAPGEYNVILDHACYEDVQFTATIVRGETLSYTDELIPKNGHVSISARKGDAPREVPVYVNGKKAGMTPFDEDVSVCAKITVGEDYVAFPKAILAHEETEWVYEVPEAPLKVESGIKTEESSDDSDGFVKLVFQGILGISSGGVSEDQVEDEDILSFYDKMGPYDYFEDFYGRGYAYSESASISTRYLYLDVFLGVELAQLLTVGVAAGIGTYFLTSDNDEKLAKDLPDAGFAPNISVEATVGTSHVGGVRYRYIFDSRWPSSRISGFYEWQNLVGIEIGAAATSGLGESLFFSLYCRALPRGLAKYIKKAFQELKMEMK